MTLSEAVLLVLVAAVSLWLGRGAGRFGRVLLVISALVISALFFLPSSSLRTAAGPGIVGSLYAFVGKLSWDLPDAVHFVIFIWLAMLLRLLRRDLRGWRGLVVLLVLSGAAEATQALTDTREARLSDVVTNLMGAGVGVLLSEGLLAIRRYGARRSRNRN